MSIDKIKPGMTLVANPSLPKAPAALVTRSEQNCSVNLHLLLVPTPPDVWDTIQPLLGLPVRPSQGRSFELNFAYIPYKDGNMNYYEGDGAVLSGEFTGCLMATYLVDGHTRRVSHVPTSSGTTDCKAHFRDLFIEKSDEHDPSAPYKLVQYFRPFTDKSDGAWQLTCAPKLFNAKMAHSVYCINTMGITLSRAGDNKCLAVTVFSNPAKAPGLYHVLKVETPTPTCDLKEFAGLKTSFAI